MASQRYAQTATYAEHEENTIEIIDYSRPMKDIEEKIKEELGL